MTTPPVNSAADPTELSVLRFSTDHLPEKDRLPYWREAFGRGVAKLDIESLVEGPFRGQAVLTNLPDCRLMLRDSQQTCARRTHRLIADGNDDIVLVFNLKGTGAAEQCGRKAMLAQGDAVLFSAAEAAFAQASRCLSVCIPLRLLKSMAPTIEDQFGKRIPRDNPTLRLLASYFETWHQGELAATPELGRAFAGHIHDLVALTLSASADVAEMAAHGGGRVARLALIQREIERGFADPRFSLPTLANRTGVSARYVQMLLGQVNSSFVKEVNDRRLKRAFDLLLRSPPGRYLSLADIALECGFTTMAHFHRMFRRQYGVTPGELRNGLTG
jgi:AraC-like DNA-binding protein